MIECSDFEKVELRTGTILKVEDFTAARKPAYIIHVDFGELGIKKSSAQITEMYTKDDLIGKQIIGVVNFPSKQIGPIQSEFLITGFYSDNGVILAVPDIKIKNGLKLG